jgi:hypothetical protein
MSEKTVMGCVVVALLSVGCTMPAAVSESDRRSATDNIRYERDRRTGLCFAMLSSASYNGYYVISITSVPESACRVTDGDPQR